MKNFVKINNGTIQTSFTLKIYFIFKATDQISFVYPHAIKKQQYESLKVCFTKRFLTGQKVIGGPINKKIKNMLEIVQIDIIKSYIFQYFIYIVVLDLNTLYIFYMHTLQNVMK